MPRIFFHEGKITEINDAMKNSTRGNHLTFMSIWNWAVFVLMDICHLCWEARAMILIQQLRLICNYVWKCEDWVENYITLNMKIGYRCLLFNCLHYTLVFYKYVMLILCIFVHTTMVVSVFLVNWYCCHFQHSSSNIR